MKTFFLSLRGFGLGLKLKTKAACYTDNVTNQQPVKNYWEPNSSEIIKQLASYLQGTSTLIAYNLAIK